MITCTTLNAIALALTMALSLLMTSNPSGHVIGWNKSPKDSRNVMMMLRGKERRLHERDVGGGYDYVTEIYSSYDSMGGIGSLVDIDDVPVIETPSCVEPTIDELRRCVDTVPSVDDFIGSESTLEHDLVHRFNFSIYASEPTPTTINVELGEGEHALNERSLCPWRYKTNSDINRYPVDIQYAQCQCHNCIDPDIHALSITNLCRPVVSWKVVLMRGACLNGTYQYIEESIPIPVACVCDRRNYST